MINGFYEISAYVISLAVGFLNRLSSLWPSLPALAPWCFSDFARLFLMTSLNGSGVSRLRLNLTDFSGSSLWLVVISLSSTLALSRSVEEESKEWWCFTNLIYSRFGLTPLRIVWVASLLVRAFAIYIGSGGRVMKSSLSIRFFLHLLVVNETYLISNYRYLVVKRELLPWGSSPSRYRSLSRNITHSYFLRGSVWVCLHSWIGTRILRLWRVLLSSSCGGGCWITVLALKGSSPRW